MKTFLFFLSACVAIALTVMFFKAPEKETIKPIDHLTIAILAKDKAHTLPMYLELLEQQTFAANKTFLYIRTNNNTDDTANILKQWVDKVGYKYAGVHFDASDVAEKVQDYKQHEWNALRFKVLGKIRQDSLDFARNNNSHYFVADCDNFIHPHTIQTLYDTKLPIVAPFLKGADTGFYANYHSAVDSNGYFLNAPQYEAILTRQLKGLIEQPVVHCTYFIRHDVLDKMSYDDNSFRYEYVIFSDKARNQNIPQYLDNREMYGRVSFAETKEDLKNESWLHEFQTVVN